MLVVVAADASPRAVEKVVRLAEGRGVHCVWRGRRRRKSGARLGRPPVMVVGVRDAALARGVMRVAAARAVVTEDEWSRPKCRTWRRSSAIARGTAARAAAGHGMSRSAVRPRRSMTARCPRSGSAGSARSARRPSRAARQEAAAGRRPRPPNPSRHPPSRQAGPAPPYRRRSRRGARPWPRPRPLACAEEALAFEREKPSAAFEAPDDHAADAEPRGAGPRALQGPARRSSPSRAAGAEAPRPRRDAVRRPRRGRRAAATAPAAGHRGRPDDRCRLAQRRPRRRKPFIPPARAQRPPVARPEARLQQLLVPRASAPSDRARRGPGARPGASRLRPGGPGARPGSRCAPGGPAGRRPVPGAPVARTFGPDAREGRRPQEGQEEGAAGRRSGSGAGEHPQDARRHAGRGRAASGRRPMSRPTADLMAGARGRGARAREDPDPRQRVHLRVANSPRS